MKMDNIVIHECNLEHLEEIKYICEKTFCETFMENNSEEDMVKYLKEQFSYEQLESEVKNQASKFFIVRNSGKAVGYMKINFDKAQTEEGHNNTLEVQRIYILKEYKGKGIGKLLMQRAIQIAKDNNLNYIWLGVWEHNLSAIKFYEKHGFKTFSTHIFKLGEDEQTDYLMKRIL